MNPYGINKFGVAQYGTGKYGGDGDVVVADTWSANNTELSAYDANLISAWQYKEDALLADTKGGVTLLNNNSVTSVSGGISGYCAHFEGTYDKYLHNSDDAGDLDPVDGTIIVSTWVNFDSLPMTDYADFALPTLFTLNNASGMIARLYVDNYTPTGEGLMFRVYQSDGTSIKNKVGSKWSVTTGTWYSVIGIADTQDNKIHLYLDGSEIGTGISYDGTTRTGAVNLKLGDGEIGGGWELDGKLDEQYVWTGVEFADATARDAFVTALYESGDGAFYTG